MSLEGIMLNEISQMQPGKYCVISSVKVKLTKAKCKILASRDCGEDKGQDDGQRVQTECCKLNKIFRYILQSDDCCFLKINNKNRF